MALNAFEKDMLIKTHDGVQELVVLFARMDERINHLEERARERGPRRNVVIAGAASLIAAAAGSLTKLAK